MVDFVVMVDFMSMPMPRWWSLIRRTANYRAQ